MNRFFCESCSKEVPVDAAVCPHCGRRFTAVRCPRCGFESDARQFLTGCPACGYALPGPLRGGGGKVPRPGGAQAPDKGRVIPPGVLWTTAALLGAAIIALLLVLLLKA